MKYLAKFKFIYFIVIYYNKGIEKIKQMNTLKMTTPILSHFGYTELPPFIKKEGYLLNISLESNSSGVYFNLYFVTESEKFCVKKRHFPSFLVESMNNHVMSELIKKEFCTSIERVEIVQRIDPTESNHLNKKPKEYLRVFCFDEQKHKMLVNDLKKLAKYRRKTKSDDIYIEKDEDEEDKFYKMYKTLDDYLAFEDFKIFFDKTENDILTIDNLLIDIAEFDIPYEIDFLSTNNIRIGKYYFISKNDVDIYISESSQILPPKLVVLAFDIEVTKDPLKFPCAEKDEIVMISFVVNGEGFLLTNREFVSEEIEDFYYNIEEHNLVTNFKIFNMDCEALLLCKFIELIFLHKPDIVTTYNGTTFDIPFIERRLANLNFNCNAQEEKFGESKFEQIPKSEFMELHGNLNTYKQKSKFNKNLCHSLGRNIDFKKYHMFSKIFNVFEPKLGSDKNFSFKKLDKFSKNNPTLSIFRDILHLDCFLWVKRDSYLPMGMQSLKSATKAKLGYQPDEIDPEEMMWFMQNDPQKLAVYSVSDAISTYLLYTKYVHPFIFSLCTLIPMNSEDVLSKGSGTLCEALLISEGFKKNILIPERKIGDDFYYKGRLCEEVNYVGGHVECLRSGIFRSDFNYNFHINLQRLEWIKENIQNILRYSGDIDETEIHNLEKKITKDIDNFKLEIIENENSKTSRNYIIPQIISKSESITNEYYNSTKTTEKQNINDDIIFLNTVTNKNNNKISFDRISNVDESGSNNFNAASPKNHSNLTYIKQNSCKKMDDHLDSTNIITCKPKIYHMDVAAMYPNIIITNRLQPVSVITNENCIKCDFYQSNANCQRKMNWKMRVQFYPSKSGEILQIKRQLSCEKIGYKELEKIGYFTNNKNFNDPNISHSSNNQAVFSDGKKQQSYIEKDKFSINFDELSLADQKLILKERILNHSKNIYRKTNLTEIIDMQNIVCQRDEPFYVEVVKNFRDKRYEYKCKYNEIRSDHENLKKQYDQLIKDNLIIPDTNVKMEIIENEKLSKLVLLNEEIDNVKNKMIIFESLQIAHKCILNSFYGYVMRKGARWYSMEMAAIVCNTGSQIIKTAKEFVDDIGLPLELDTDGIWCLIPTIFPDIYTLNNGKSFSFLVSILNFLVSEKFTNYQYQDEIFEKIENSFSRNTVAGYKVKSSSDKTSENTSFTNKRKKITCFEPDVEKLTRKNSISRKYEINKINTISFEIDGPYKAMILPASTDEGKLIKKKYVVINNQDKICELKGFETKRRGELEIIKKFQEDLFQLFVLGSTLEECYSNIKDLCQYWLSLVTNKGNVLTDHDIFELFSESKNMSKEYKQYMGRKTTATCTAIRLSEFLGENILKESGLKCQYVISKFPENCPITARAIPVEVFQIEASKKDYFLEKWTGRKFTSLKDILDWEYYRERLENVILKVVVLPAILQGIGNILPGVKVPEWTDKGKINTITRYASNIDIIQNHNINNHHTQHKNIKNPHSISFLDSNICKNSNSFMDIEFLGRKNNCEIEDLDKKNTNIYSNIDFEKKHIKEKISDKTSDFNVIHENKGNSEKNEASLISNSTHINIDDQQNSQKKTKNVLKFNNFIKKIKYRWKCIYNEIVKPLILSVEPLKITICKKMKIKTVSKENILNFILVPKSYQSCVKLSKLKNLPILNQAQERLLKSEYFVDVRIDSFFSNQNEFEGLKCKINFNKYQDNFSIIEDLILKTNLVKLKCFYERFNDILADRNETPDKFLIKNIHKLIIYSFIYGKIKYYILFFNGKVKIIYEEKNIKTNYIFENTSLKNKLQKLTKFNIIAFASQYDPQIEEIKKTLEYLGIQIFLINKRLPTAFGSFDKILNQHLVNIKNLNDDASRHFQISDYSGIPILNLQKMTYIDILDFLLCKEYNKDKIAFLGLKQKAYDEIIPSHFYEKGFYDGYCVELNIPETSLLSIVESNALIQDLNFDSFYFSKEFDAIKRLVKNLMLLSFDRNNEVNVISDFDVSQSHHLNFLNSVKDIKKNDETSLVNAVDFINTQNISMKEQSMVSKQKNNVHIKSQNLCTESNQKHKFKNNLNTDLMLKNIKSIKKDNIINHLKFNNSENSDIHLDDEELLKNHVNMINHDTMRIDKHIVVISNESGRHKDNLKLLKDTNQLECSTLDNTVNTSSISAEGFPQNLNTNRTIKQKIVSSSSTMLSLKSSSGSFSDKQNDVCIEFQNDNFYASNDSQNELRNQPNLAIIHKQEGNDNCLGISTNVLVKAIDENTRFIKKHNDNIIMSDVTIPTFPESSVNIGNFFCKILPIWLKETSKLLPEEHMSYIKLLNKKYLFVIYNKLISLGCKIVCFNKETVIIYTEKNTYKSCMDYLTFIKSMLNRMKGLELVSFSINRVYRKLVFIDFHNYFFDLYSEKNPKLILANSQTNVFKRFLDEFFDGKIENKYFYDLIIKKKSQNIKGIKMMINIVETKRNVNELRTSCYKMLGINTYEEDDIEELKFELFCSSCNTENLVLIKENDISRCIKCFATYSEDILQSAISKYISKLLSNTEEQCLKCKLIKKKKLGHVCICGGEFNSSKIESLIHKLSKINVFRRLSAKISALFTNSLQ
ncbi:hypothetical protein EDEG_00707 [Edhazardia aedis USNM 41457]|uniref:DNA polymerase epsilon catalytic subunit A n=1 Tax=Edhazardia aedis (strain USNM 41457) TaxID=1003232 RepID=J9DVC7_EDHAE|nr:hypothetical protein EDEG_00707 [Edhazardia aedis USNM 41457]|eukprot:EJW05242.1 hypothetical protein EDEG_00707 [Edhazardia aedis USNM 41457]